MDPYKVEVNNWSIEAVNSYIDNSMRDFTDEQQLYMANRIITNVEEKKRFATEHQNDNYEPSI